MQHPCLRCNFSPFGIKTPKRENCKTNVPTVNPPPYHQSPPHRGWSVVRGRYIIIPMAVLGDPLVFRGDVGLGPLEDGQSLSCHHVLLQSTSFLGIHMSLIHALL